MIRDVNLLNNGSANLLVPKSEVLSAEVTLSNLISLASTFSLISNSAKSRCRIPLVMFSTAGSGSRIGVNTSVVLGPWVRLYDDSVVLTVDGGDVAYDSVVSTVDGGNVGLKAGDSSSLLSVWSSALNCSLIVLSLTRSVLENAIGSKF